MSELRKLAEAVASGGEQDWYGPDGLSSYGLNSEDAAYIAAASPDVILALLDERDMMRAQIIGAGDYGLGRDGCPFCGGVARHNACVVEHLRAALDADVR